MPDKSGQETIREQIAGVCRHYNGMMATCKAGVHYMDMTEQDTETATWRFDLPCFKRPMHPELPMNECPHQSFPTDEEVEAQAVGIEQATVAMFKEIEARHCIHCHAPVEKYSKVGRCVYADPCGHRQWQGNVPPDPPKEKEGATNG